MYKLDYIIETKSPVAFAEKNNDSTLYTTKKYIPGTAFRGLFANKFIQDHHLQNAHEHADFYDIFLSGKVRFLPAYPLGKTKLNDYEPFIVPLSLTKSKTSKETKDLADVNAKLAAGFKKMNGFALQKGSKFYYPVDITTQVDLHMGRTKDKSRITGSSNDGDIFNYEYLEPHQYFKGTILVDDDLITQTVNALKILTDQEVHLGHSKNVQYGKCQILIENQQKLQPNLKTATSPLYIYALTPYIPYENWQRTDELAKALLKSICQELQIDDISITDEDLFITDKDNNKRLGIFAANEDISGFVNIWKAQHERQTALSAGSLIVIPAKILAKIDLNTLAQVLYQGFGYRTSEGFGQFRIWQPNSLTLAEENLPEVDEKLTAPICAEVQAVAKAIVKQRLLNEYKQLAAKHANRQYLNMQSLNKNVLNRLEVLMDSSDSKLTIQQKIRAFKAKAQNNLRQIYFKQDILLDILLEQDNNTLPYADFDVNHALKLPQAELRADLGSDFALSEDEKYRTYWLWFVRHAKKEMDNADIDDEGLNKNYKVV